MLTPTTRTILAAMAAMVPGAAAAAPPQILILEGPVHVLTFTSPGIYDFSVDDQHSDGVLDRLTVISHDRKGKIEGLTTDSDGTGLKLVTEISGTCKTTRGVTVVKTKHKGYGEFGNGDAIKASATKVSEVHGSGAGATLFTTIKMRQCIKQKQPFKDTYSVVCSRGGGTDETPFAKKGDWEARMELAQPVVGEILGVGSISTNIHSSKFKRTTEVIVAGTYREDGTAKLKLTPVHKGGDGPVTITVQVVAGPGVTYPVVTAVLEVKGKLLGQGFNEVVF